MPQNPLWLRCTDEKKQMLPALPRNKNRSIVFAVRGGGTFFVSDLGAGSEPGTRGGCCPLYQPWANLLTV